MFSYLTGTLTEKFPTSVTVEAHGIGYQLTVPLSTHQTLPETGNKVKLLTHFVVREDAHVLYGFTTEEERDLFRLLISVSGIGPKSAITILSGLGVSELRQAIIDGALPVLTSISGIGRKTAERLIVELREKVVLDERRTGAPRHLEAQEGLVNDSVKALVSLGYGRQDAKNAIQKALSHHRDRSEKLKVEELIRHSLKYI